MSIATTGIMKQQLMRNPTDTTPEAGMEGGVTRPSIVGDLMSAMNDMDFNQLVKQYQAMSGNPHKEDKPLTNQMMKEEQPSMMTPILPQDNRTPLSETDMGKAMEQKYEGEPLTPVINPNEMPSLEGTFSAMPVLGGNPVPPTKALSFMEKPFEIEI
jgi:hypothetical protein